MLDNFGMGEFLMLAIFALLFFGPERLPQMGARLGRWLSQMTQASKVFMSQWTEEAAAIQDAVREVQGIRDEIRAAQAEISGSLDVARQDIVQTIDEARSTVREATVTPQDFLQASAADKSAAPDAGAPDTSAPPKLATQEEVEKITPVAAPSGGETEALSKTQSVLDDLMAKRGLSPAATDEPGDNGVEPTEAAVEAAPDASSAGAQDSEYERNLKAAQEIMERGARRAAEQAQASKPEDGTAAASVQAQAAPPSLGQDEQPDQAEPEEKAEPAPESAFDKTQRILDGLLGKTKPEPTVKAAGPAIAPPREESEPAAPASAAKAADTAAAAGAAKAVSLPKSASAPGAIQVTGLQEGVSFNEFTKLSIQVTQLGRELRTLQKELQALRSQASASNASTPVTAAADDSKAAPMEEAA